MHVISMTWKSHVSGMRDDLHPFLPFATPVATISWATPTFVKHSAKALRNKYSLSLLLSPLLLRHHVHPVLPTWRATNQTDKRLWPWSEPPATTTIRHQEQKRKNSQQLQTKIYPHTLAHWHTLLTVWIHVPFALRGHNCSGKLYDAFLFGTQNP